MPNPMIQDSNLRSLFKAVSYRFLGTLATFLTSWLVTDDTRVALSLTAIDFFAKILLFWFHERLWVRIPRQNLDNR